MQLWQLVMYCADGSYLAGDTFINEQGQTITFDGQQVVGLDAVAVEGVWEHIEDYKARKGA